MHLRILIIASALAALAASAFAAGKPVVNPHVAAGLQPVTAALPS